MSQVFKPFISASDSPKEFTFRAVTLGLILGMIFGVGNAYLALRVGTTVSASIPAAVLSVLILKRISKNATILENNMVQTIASVGEGLAGGVVFTIPALYLIHASSAATSPLRVFLLATLGGILGVLFMIPMRRYIIVQEHGKPEFPFPEGTACAAILISSHKATAEAKFAVWGIIVGAVYKIFSGLTNIINEVPRWTMKKGQAVFSMDCTPALFGVGYIIGPRVSSVMLAGGALSWWVFIPLLSLFGDAATQALSPDEIWSQKIRYIGAGTVAVAGLMSLLKIGKVLYRTIQVGFKELFSKSRCDKATPRTDRDISMRWLVLGSMAILLILALFPGIFTGASMTIVTIALLALLGFFFVAVTSLTVGIVGSTSNPVSGMTITTILITCLVFALIGWTGETALVGVLTMGCVVNVAISLAGTTSQDLKTGFLLGATPRLQQIGEFFGIIFPAAFLGGVILILNSKYAIGSAAMPAPQASMIAFIAKGVMLHDFPIALVSIGAVIGLIIELLGISALPFALGLYLPLNLSTAVALGGGASYLSHKLYSKKHTTIEVDELKERGTLLASGLIAGDACMGVAIALLGSVTNKSQFFPDWVSLAVFGLGGIFFIRAIYRRPKIY